MTQLKFVQKMCAKTNSVIILFRAVELANLSYVNFL